MSNNDDIPESIRVKVNELTECALQAIRERDEARAQLVEARRLLETLPPWTPQRGPMDDTEMHALRLRWSTGPEQYQADADALIATAQDAIARAEQAESRVSAVEAELAKAWAYIPGSYVGLGIPLWNAVELLAASERALFIRHLELERESTVADGCDTKDES